MKIYKITGGEIVFPKYVQAESKSQAVDKLDLPPNKPNLSNQGYDIVEISQTVDKGG